MISRVCSLGATAVAAPVAIGCASLATSSLPLIATGLSIAALLGAVGWPRQHGAIHLVQSLQYAWKAFEGAASVYGMGALGKAVLANPASIPTVLTGYSSAILSAARFLVRATPFFLTLTLALGALACGMIAGGSARAALLGS